MLNVKRIISAIAAAALTMTFSASVYAASHNGVLPGANLGPFDIQIRNNGDVKPDYWVEITWGSLTFNYTQPAWDPSTHTYPGAGILKVENEGGNLLTITNHSNVLVNIEFLFEPIDNSVTKWGGINTNFTCGELSGSEITVPLEAWDDGQADGSYTAQVAFMPVADEIFQTRFQREWNYASQGPHKCDMGTICLTLRDPNPQPDES